MLGIRNNKGQFIKGCKRPDIAGLSNPMHKIEIKERVRKSLIGKKKSKESIEKQKKSMKELIKKRGYLIPIESRKRISEKMKTIMLGNKNGHGGKGRKASKETCLKQSIAQKGKPKPWKCGINNYFWKGGITKLRPQIYNSINWKKWRSDIFQRDNWTCQTCHIKGGYLEAHHIKQFCMIMEEYKIKSLEQALNCKELWDRNNGITLCKDCHNLTKKGYTRT